MLDISKKILYIFVRESYMRSFGRFFVPSLTSIDVSKLPKKITYDFTVPPSICRNHPSSDKPVCSTGALLALFDELSSQSMMVKDKDHRPGVSVHLETQLIKPIYADDELTIITKGDKIGKSIGFFSVEFHRTNDDKDNSERTLVAQGKHIKYMPADFYWYFLANKYTRNFSYKMYEMFRGSKFKTPIDNIFMNWNKKIKLIERNDEDKKLGYLFNVLDVKYDNDSKEYKVIVKNNMKNMLGTFHGGALASSIDQALYLFNKKAIEEDKIPLQLDDIDVRYLTSMNNEVYIQVTEDDDSPFLSSTNVRTKSIGKVFNKKRKVCAEFTCHWKLI